MLKNIDEISGWGLTEPDIGSDASSLTTSVRETPEGYVINGKKRWIGNGNGGILVVWARNETTKQVEGFIVETKNNGVTAVPIQRKLALRVVQNCDI
jgi:acyl-CoA oxidase